MFYFRNEFYCHMQNLDAIRHLSSWLSLLLPQDRHTIQIFFLLLLEPSADLCEQMLSHLLETLKTKLLTGDKRRDCSH